MKVGDRVANAYTDDHHLTGTVFGFVQDQPTMVVLILDNGFYAEGRHTFITMMVVHNSNIKVV
jgi:hypothetical protein